MWIENGELRMAAPSPRAFDGVDLTIRGDLDVVLTIELAGPDKPATVIEMRLSELVRDTQTHALDKAGNRLTARRAPGDALRVSPPETGLVLAPGERLPLRIHPRWLDVEPGAKIRIDYEVRPARGAKAVYSTSREIDWPAADAPPPDLVEEFRAPEAPGAYDLAITASSRSLRQRFGLRQTLADRTVQFVVVDSRPPAETVASQAALELVAELDPTASRWWEQVARLPGTQLWWRGPVGSGHAAAVEHPLGRVVELRAREASPSGNEPSWEAYPLSIDRPGQCHLLEIEYPGDKRQQLGACVIDGGAMSRLPPLAIDQGLVSSAPDAASPQWRRHRIAFWPRSKNPVVLLVNRSGKASAWFGKLSVYELPAEAPPANPLPGRDWLAFCDQPLLAESLGASQRVDTLAGRSIDDWQTFYEAAERLAVYLRWAGYSGMALTVAGEGSALYPSVWLQPTPRYDSGAFSTTGQDPVRKDVLELLLRVFDRHGLRLLPVVRFSSPLPALEAARRDTDEPTEGLTWVSAHGEPLLARRAPRDGAAPYYNPLDPRVQQVMAQVVGELAARCQGHPSFAGVAVRVEPEGSARLQGLDWGHDAQTLRRFAAAVALDGARLTPGETMTTHRQAWIDWRAEQMTGLVAAWERSVVAAHPTAKLYLLGVGHYSLPELQGALRPQLPWVDSSADALRESGIDLESLQRRPGVVVAVSRRWPTEAAPVGPRGRLERDRARDLAGDVRRPGAAFQWREGRRQSLQGVELRGPVKGPPASWLAQSSPDEASSRRRFVEELARTDASAYIDGGTALPLIVDSAVQPLMRAHQALPAVPFEDLPGAAQPVVARRGVSGRATYLYLANTAPWPTTCRLRFHAPAGVRAEILGGRDLPPPAIAPQATWEPSLEAYDLVAIRIDAPDVDVQVERVEFDSAQLVALDQQIRDLMGRAASLQTARRYDALANASFEEAPAPGEIVPRWRLLSTTGGVRLEGPPAHEGQRSLHVVNPGGVAAVVSTPFAAPATGRLTVGAWIRVARLEPNAQVRLAVRGIDSDYYRAAPLPVEATAPDQPWRWCALRLDDLVEVGTPLEVRFEFRGGADVAIDDVRTFDLDFTQAEKIGLAQILHLAEAQLRVDKVAECRDTLSSYWPLFLEEHAPQAAPGQESPIGPLTRQATRPAAPAPQPGMLDSLKRFVPKSLRWY